MITSLAQIDNRTAGGFVACGYAGGRVTTYDQTATQLNTTTSGIGRTTNAFGCYETSSGDIIVSWDGSSDTVILYDSTLSTQRATYNDTTSLTAPRGVIEKANGNFLVADASYHYLVELDSNLNFLRAIGGGHLNYPWAIVEVREY